jgi:hypothetical protein
MVQISRQSTLAWAPNRARVFLNTVEQRRRRALFYQDGELGIQMRCVNYSAAIIASATASLPAASSSMPSACM